MWIIPTLFNKGSVINTTIFQVTGLILVGISIGFGISVGKSVCEHYLNSKPIQELKYDDSVNYIESRSDSIQRCEGDITTSNVPTIVSPILGKRYIISDLLYSDE